MNAEWSESRATSARGSSNSGKLAVWPLVLCMKEKFSVDQLVNLHPVERNLNPFHSKSNEVTCFPPACSGQIHLALFVCEKSMCQLHFKERRRKTKLNHL